MDVLTETAAQTHQIYNQMMGNGLLRLLTKAAVPISQNKVLGLVVKDGCYPERDPCARWCACVCVWDS